MTPIHRFQLQPDGRPEGLRSDVLFDGKPAHMRLPGKRLVAQFATQDSFLLITDYHDAAEESTCVILLDERLKPVSWRSIGPVFSFMESIDAGFSVRKVEWKSPTQFELHSYNNADSFGFTIRRRGVRYLFPRLGMRRLEHRDER